MSISFLEQNDFSDEELLFAPESEEESASDETSKSKNEIELSEDFTSWKILVVDDEEDVHVITQMLFEDVTHAGKPIKIIDAYSGKEARDILSKNNDIALIFLDVVMESSHAGLEVVEFLRNKLNNQLTRVILRTGQPGEAPESKVILEYEIEDYKLKTELTAQKMITSLIGGLRSYSSLRNLQIENQLRQIAEDDLQKAFEKLDLVFEQTVESLTSLLETRDNYTAGHARHVGMLAEAIGRKMQLKEESCRALRLAGLLHDIGKNSIPLKILNKTGKLTEEEWKQIKKHPLTGYNVLKKIDYPWSLAEIVYQHHERIDGKGYPRGIAGTEILLESQILGVADIIEAIMLARPYRKALGLEKALITVRSMRGTSFNEDVVDACMAVFDEGFRFEG